MAKMRRFDNGGSVSEKPQGATRYDDRGRVIPLYEEDSGIVAQRASQAAPSYSTKLGNVDTSDSRNMQETIAKLKGIVGLPGGEQYGNITMPEIVKSMYQKSQSPTTPTPADHFTNLPSGSAAQVNAMRNVVGLPETDEAANKQKAMDMMRSIVGLNPNTNNYSLQDAISQLKGQYSAPRRGVANSDMNYGGGPGGGGMELPKNMGASIPDNGPPPVGPSSSAPPREPMMQPPPERMAMPPTERMKMPPPDAPPIQQPVNDTGRVNPAIAALANAKLGNQMKNRGQSRFAPQMEYSKGGKVKAYAKGGSVSASSRGDGCAQRGKTRGMMR